jgi:hypothetical protein
MLKITRGRKSLSPLQFSTKCSFYLFDVCCPSLVLALAVNQVSLSAACDDVPRARSLVAKAERQLRKSVLEAGITIGKTRAKHLWRVIARLESKSQYAGVVRDAFADTAVRSLDGTSDRYAKYREQYMEWLDDTDTPLKVSKRDIRRLAQIALFSPAVSILRAVIHAKCKSEGVLASAESLQECLTETTNLCMNQLRNYFNRDLAQAVIRRHGGPGSYTSQVLEYCCRAQFQAVVDEYVYLVRCVLQREGTKKVCKHLAEVLGMYSGSPSINHRGTHGKISSAGKPKSAHFALAFGEDVVASDDSGKERRSRKSAVREAFNSPFWPFVLATTSVGQEGLDFHLYCKDVVHWNLPGNPVDLEQREGRINRYDGLCIRRSIAAEHPLRKLPPFQEGKVGNPWEWVFDNLAATPQDNRDSQGLFPHWVYPSTNGQQEMIRRHVLFYSDSVDRGAYDRLKESLMLYRLVFGQPRQQDLLEHVADELAKIEEGEKRDMLLKTLPKYMIDLSPVSDGAGAN